MLDEPHRAFYSLMINGVAFHYKSVLIRQPISGFEVSREHGKQRSRCYIKGIMTFFNCLNALNIAQKMAKIISQNNSRFLPI